MSWTSISRALRKMPWSLTAPPLARDNAVAVFGFADGSGGSEAEAGEVKRGGDFRVDIQPADEARRLILGLRAVQKTGAAIE